MNFSVPDEVNERFNRTFAGQKKSQIIAKLMMRAAEEQASRKRRARAIDALLRRRSGRPALSAAQILKARSDGRP